MKRLMSLPATIAMLSLLLVGCASAAAQTQPFPDPPTETMAAPTGPQTAVLAGGCFWGMQGVFERVKGVTDTEVGFSGGKAATAHYEVVSSGTTGHAETIKISYDPSVISYGTILKIYFSVATDPTELNFQGPDYGTQYRGVIFYQNDYQKTVAQDYVKKLTDAKVYSKPIVTQLVPFQAFYPAEEYHQHFMDKNPNYPYIVMWDRPKVSALQREYPSLVAD